MCADVLHIGYDADFSIWWIVLPGYAIALALSLYTPKMFTAIAFDSGGVASGPMTATFILPFATGACAAVSNSDVMQIMLNGFGVVALVAMTPLIVVQIIGAIYKYKLSKVVDTQEHVYEYEEVIEFLLPGLRGNRVVCPMPLGRARNP